MNNNNNQLRKTGIEKKPQYPRPKHIGLGILVLFSLICFSIQKFSIVLENQTIACSDVLSVYAEKPEELKFMGCVTVENSQTILRATYQVSGEKSREVEDFLIQNYGMGKLKWTCCRWDNGGIYGGFDHIEFKKINPYCSATISMHGSAEIEDKNPPNEIKLEFNRNKIEYFTVVVELVIV